MKFTAFSLLLALLALPTQAEEKKTESAPLQAVIAKTPEEKAKVETQISSYPLKTCLVSGDDLGAMGETINTLYGEQLIRFCCKDACDPLIKNPPNIFPSSIPPKNPPPDLRVITSAPA